MPDLSYSLSASERNRGDFPYLPIVNMLAENVPSEPNTVLQSRPGLKNSAIDMGDSPVRGLFKQDGVLSNQLFGVAGTDLYSSSTLVGAIDGTGPVSFDGYEDYVFVNAGESVWSYNGTTLAAITFPDSADVCKIVVGASRLIAVRKNTGTFYWTEPLGVTFDALDFATAENSSDVLKDALFLADRLMLFGTETIEIWPTSTDANLPFTPLTGATMPIGIKDTGLAVEFNKTFAWVTNYNEICVGDPSNIITEPDLQVKIANSTEASLWTFFVDDNEYLAIRIDNETWVYGARTGVWSTMESYGYDNWICQCYESGYFGSTIDGVLVEWSDDYSDFDSILSRVFRAWAPITSGSLMISNIMLRTNPGNTPYLSGQYADPVVELRTSNNGGRQWHPWKSRLLGSQGEYRTKTVWSSMGQFSYPGLLVEVRTSDPVPFRVSGFVYNEPFGGM